MNVTVLCITHCWMCAGCYLMVAHSRGHSCNVIQCKDFACLKRLQSERTCGQDFLGLTKCAGASDTHIGVYPHRNDV